MIKTTLRLIFCLLCVVCAAGAQVADAVDVYLGEQSIIDVFDADMISLGNPDLADVRAMGDTQLIVRGRKTGETDLITWNDAGSRRVIRLRVLQPVSGRAADIRDMLRDIENLRIRAVGDKIVLEGRLLLKSDADKVGAVAAAFGESILNLTALDRGRENELLGGMIVKDVGLDGVKVSVVGDTVFLSGYVYNAGQKEQIVKLAETQFEKVVNLLEVREVMIGIDVIFLQVTKSKGHNLGGNILGGKISATGSIQGTRSRTARGEYTPMQVGIGYNVNLQHTLNLLMSNGGGSVLSRPHLSTKSGESGRFHSGGEFFFKVEGAQSVDIKSVEYGLILEVKPSLVSSNEVISEVSIDVTVPVNKAGSEDLNLERFSINNTVTCRLGESIVISGFVENLRNHFRERAPLLGRIPLLNIFFGQSVKSDSDKELVAILTPRLLNASKGAAEPNLSGLENAIQQHIMEPEDAVSNP